MATPQQVFRLSDSQLVALEKQLTPLVVTTASSDLQVAAALGEQRVLQMLRRGFTIGA